MIGSLGSRPLQSSILLRIPIHQQQTSVRSRQVQRKALFSTENRRSVLFWAAPLKLSETAVEMRDGLKP